MTEDEEKTVVGLLTYFLYFFLALASRSAVRRSSLVPLLVLGRSSFVVPWPLARRGGWKYHPEFVAPSAHSAPRGWLSAMASAVAAPTAGLARGFERVGTRRSARDRARAITSRGHHVKVVCRTTRFSEQFGDAGAPKPGMLQSPPLYVKRTLRGGQAVRYPGTVIVRL